METSDKVLVFLFSNGISTCSEGSLDYAQKQLVLHPNFFPALDIETGEMFLIVMSGTCMIREIGRVEASKFNFKFGGSSLLVPKGNVRLN